MWWDGQNLSGPRKSRDGRTWHFRVWHDVHRSRHVARVFFWSDDRFARSVVILSSSSRSNLTALRALIHKLTADPTLRTKYLRDIQFPLERYYSDYGDFPADISISRPNKRMQLTGASMLRNVG
jgi:hypothetical protein